MSQYIIPYRACWSQCVINGINANFTELYAAIENITGSGNSYITLEYPGVLTDEEDFGFWVAPANCNVLGTLMTVGEPSAGGNITMDYVDGGGVEQGKISTLSAGAETEATIFVSPLSVASGATIRGKIKSIGSASTEGAYLTALMIVQYQA